MNKVYEITFRLDRLMSQDFYFDKFPSREDIRDTIDRYKVKYPHDILIWDKCLTKINNILDSVWIDHITRYSKGFSGISEVSNDIFIQVLDVNTVKDIDEIFVFGSNERGIHGAGAAKEALKYGAKLGIGYGLEGNSFAIPTKDFNIKTLNIDIVKRYIALFVLFSKIHRELKFKVTRIGCGLAGFKDSEIAPLFKDCGGNCNFDSVWGEYLGTGKKYWGTYSEPVIPFLNKKHWETNNDPIVSPSKDWDML